MNSLQSITLSGSLILAEPSAIKKTKQKRIEPQSFSLSPYPTP